MRRLYVFIVDEPLDKGSSSTRAGRITGNPDCEQGASEADLWIPLDLTTYRRRRFRPRVRPPV